MLMQGATSIGAGATSNVVQGNLYEIAPFDALVKIGLCGDAAGELRVTLITGSDVILQESPISRANRWPLNPDDFTYRDVVRRGEKINITARNTGAGANTLFWIAELTPIRRR